MKRLLGLDDVLLQQKWSEIESRDEVDTSVEFMGLTLRVPVIASNMKTVTDSFTTKLMAEYGAISCLHRFYPVHENVGIANYLVRKNVPFLASVGTTEGELERFTELWKVGVRHFIIDVAHGSNIKALRFYNQIRRLGGTSTKICVGNFGSLEAYLEFAQRVDIMPDGIKVGIGQGSACTTRQMTGVGTPTISGLLEFSQHLNIDIIQDGGCKNPGDVAKCIAAGATCVMIGGMLAAAVEAPNDGFFHGSASKYNNNNTPYNEGTGYKIENKRPLKDIINEVERGLRSSMSYTGNKTIKQFQQNAEFVEVSVGAFSETYGKYKNGK